MTEAQKLALEIGLKMVDAVISWIAGQIGETTATVKARVKARLAGPDTDETDPIFDSIDEAIRDATRPK